MIISFAIYGNASTPIEHVRMTRNFAVGRTRLLL
jgi:hypothetical protein